VFTFERIISGEREEEVITELFLGAHAIQIDVQ
jgi:hypothetical protein